MAIKWNDLDKLIDLNCNLNGQLNYLIQIENGVYYSPLMLATIKGHHQLVEYILKDPFVNINIRC